MKAPFMPIYHALTSPAFRCSGTFSVLSNLFKLSPAEEMMRTAMEFVAMSKIPGDYLEFGVYQGSSFSAAFHLARLHRLHEMRFYGFDSFQGLPEVRGCDAEGGVPFYKGEFACDGKAFERLLVKKRVDLKKVQLIPGWYDEVLNDDTKRRLPITAAAIVHIDCDLYESTVPVLRFITDYIQDGTVLLFDDWYCFRGNPERGEERAFTEWLGQHPQLRAVPYRRYSWHGNAFIISKTEARRTEAQPAASRAGGYPLDPI